MTQATLSATKVMEAVAKAKKAPPHPMYNGHHSERFKCLMALASAVRQDPLANDRMEISADDFVIIAPHWEPPIGV